MRIEVDTKSDSREELAALADMLQRLARSSGSGAIIPKPVSRNIFDDPSPGVGLMNMFGDSSAQQAPQPVQQSAYQQPASEPSGGLFSLFSDSTSQASSQSSYSQPVLAQDSEPDRKTTAKDILDDDRIQLY